MSTSIRWAEFVRSNRKANRIRQRELAHAVRIDQSYITLIEREGYVPRIDITRRISQFFGKEHEGLVCAGYSPLEGRDAVRFTRSMGYNTKLPLADIWATARSHGLDRTLDAVKSAILLAKATRPDAQSQEVVA